MTGREPSQTEQSMLQIKLHEGEKIIWSGQPDPKAVRLIDVIHYVTLVIVGIILLSGACVIFLMTIVHCDWPELPARNTAIVTLIEFCIMLPLLLLGLTYISKPFYDFQRKKRTWFVLTNKRAIVIYIGLRRCETSCLLAKPLKTTKVASPDGKGLIIFDEVPDKLLLERLTSMTPITGEVLGIPIFFDIADLDEVHRLVEDCIAQNSAQTAEDLTNTRQCVELIEGVKIRPRQPRLMIKISKLKKRSMAAVAVLLLVSVGGFEYLAYLTTPLPMGYMDKSGKMIIEPRFQDAGDFREGLAPVSVKGKWGFIDRAGNLVVAPQFDQADSFCEGFAAVLLGDKWGYIDTSGKIRIAPQYTFAGHFSGGLAPILPAGEEAPGCVFMDKSGKIAFSIKNLSVDSSSPPFQPAIGLSEGLVPVTDFNTSLCGFLNDRGKLAINAMFDDAQAFSEGLAPVRKDDKWGFIDKSGNWVIQPQFQDARSFSDGVAAVGTNAKWHFIDKSGKQVLAGEFDTVEPFSEGVAHVSVGSKKGWIDKTGRFVKDRDSGSLHDGLAVYPYRSWAQGVGNTAVKTWSVYAIYATRPIPQGRVVTEEDLESRLSVASRIPANALLSIHSLVGKTTAHPMDAGELFTTASVN